MATPQSLTQGFIQNSVGTQSAAQDAQPFIANNGNPNTVYNQTPMGGYLPPVANAYDQWRINPYFRNGGGFVPPAFEGGGAGGTLPFPVTGGGNWVPPVLPPVNRPPVTPPVTPPVVVPPQQGGGARPNYGGLGRGLGVDIGWGGRGIPNYSAFSTGAPVSSTGRGGLNGFLGTALDWLLPGDAVQDGRVNWANLGLGVLDQYTGLPLTWGLDRLANSDWAQTSDGRIARWLRDWDFQNDSAALQDWYRENGYRADDGTGWLAQDVASRNTYEPTPNAANRFIGALSGLPSTQQRAVNAFRQGGVAALEGRINPATGRMFTPSEISRISSLATGNLGVSLRAAGAFTPWGATAIQGDAARDMFEGMKDSIWGNFQVSNADR